MEFLQKRESERSGNDTTLENEIKDSQDSIKGKLEKFSEILNQLHLSGNDDENRTEIENMCVNTKDKIDSSCESNIHYQESYSSRSSHLDFATSKVAALPEKITIRLQPIGSIPPLISNTFKIASSQNFSTITVFLCRKLKLKYVYCYINNSFSPTPQQNIRELWNQFKINDELVVSYCSTVAFG